jgi:hypothetical protein
MVTTTESNHHSITRLQCEVAVNLLAVSKAASRGGDFAVHATYDSACTFIE